jgi:hypothetical protein
MTYDEIRQAVHGYMHRNDAETVDNEPTAIDLARVKLGRDFFPESAAVLLQGLAIVNGVGQLPADFGQADTVKDAAGRDLDYQTPRGWARMVGTKETQGKFSITGDKLYVDGALASVDLLYYLAPQPIGPGQTSWLSEDYPDVWIWMGVAEQHRFVQDFESAQISEQYAYELAGKAVFRTRANRGGGSLRMVTRR